MGKKEINPIFLERKGREKLAELAVKNWKDLNPQENILAFMDFTVKALMLYNLKDTTEFLYNELEEIATNQIIQKYVRGNNIDCKPILEGLVENENFAQFYKKYFID